MRTRTVGSGIDSFYLSKSKYIQGLQCPKLLWHSVHRPEDFPPTSATTQFKFDQGHEVGELAKTLYPGGIDIPWEPGRRKALELTRAGIQERRPIYEATLCVNRNGLELLAKIDILVPAGRNAWDLIEVKSTSSIKEQHIPDAAFQKYLAERVGLKIRNSCIMHLNSEYRFNGRLDPASLFSLADVNLEVEEHLTLVGPNLDRFQELLAEASPPATDIGSHCSSPYECDLSGLCWAHLPEHSVTTLVRGKKKAWWLYADGITDIRDIPADFPLSANQRIQYDCVTNGCRHVDREGIAAFLNELEYPLYFLDFETFSTPIPFFEGIGPWHQVPFQFSLHIHESEGAPLQHHSFLADLGTGPDDPRPLFLSTLKQLLGDHGSIIAYNASFEATVLRKCAEVYPQYNPWLDSNILPRIRDLITPFRSFFIYDPAQRGSTSIKNVLPAFTKVSYEGMDIQDGQTASIAFLQTCFGCMNEEEIRRTRTSLESYCSLDTKAMVEVLSILAQKL
jgi:hypothetical protein